MSSPLRISWENFLLSQSVTLEQFRTTCATPFQAHPVTASRVLAMDAGCDLSTRGLWGGPMICNEWDRDKPLGDSGHLWQRAAPPCYYYGYYNYYFKMDIIYN